MSNIFPPYGVPAKMETVICKGCEREIFEQPWVVSADFVEYGPYCKVCAVYYTEKSASNEDDFVASLAAINFWAVW